MRAVAPVFARGSGPVARTAGGAGGADSGLSFTMRDRLALEAWRLGAEHHGYRRVEIASATAESAGEAMFALIYPPATPWARWGISCCAGSLVAWRCGTGETIGRFDTMVAALAAIPPVSGETALDATVAGR